MSVDPTRFMIDLSNNIDDPYPLYHRFRDVAPVHRLGDAPGDRSEWIVLGAGAAAETLSTPAFGRRAAQATGQAGSIVPPTYPTLSKIVDGWMIFMDPPRHTEVRRAVSAWLASRVSRPGFLMRLAETTTSLVNEAFAHDRFDVMECASVMSSISSLSLLDIPEADWEQLRGLIDGLQQGSSLRAGPRSARLPAAEVAAVGLDRYFRAFVSERRRRPTGDLSSHLIGLGWHENLITATCVHLLNAGQETTRSMLGTSVKLLVLERALCSGLISRPADVDDVVNEFLRFDPPAQMVHRWAYADIRLGGKTIRQGDKVTVMIGAACRDPAVFVNPDRVRLDRSHQRTLAFGLGSHYCAGSHLGRAVMAACVTASSRKLAPFRIEHLTYSSQELNFRGPESLVLVRQR